VWEFTSPLIAMIVARAKPTKHCEEVDGGGRGIGPVLELA